MPPPSSTKTILTSAWDGLNENLIAKFYEVDRKGNSLGNVEVWAPLLEANMEMTFCWNSPFENAGAQNTSIANMVTSGAMQDVADVLKTGNGGWADSMLDKAEKNVKRFEGRTGITKLNSTQIFTGMQPVKIPVTALFRAWRDPQMEVERPTDQLMAWALPIELAPDGSIIARAVAAARGKGDIDHAPLPSKSPTMIAMDYKGYTYGPLVIESIGRPLSSPVDYLGRFVSLQVPMTLCSLTAIDRDDWKGWRNFFSYDP